MANILQDMTWWAQALVLGWLALAIIIGVPMILRDERRLKLVTPRQADIDAEVERLMTLHGTIRAAYHATGRLMIDAYYSGESNQRLRLLKAASALLAERMMEETGIHNSAEAATQLGTGRQGLPQV
jgi:hypothetical protein